MFKEARQTIVEKTDGSLGALIMGADGLSVEKFFTEEGSGANLDVAAAESLPCAMHASWNDPVSRSHEMVFALCNPFRSLSSQYFVFSR